MRARTAAAPTPGARPIRPRRAVAAAPTTIRMPGSLSTWYLGLIPYWMGAAPGLKARLLLRTHEWIVDRVLAPEVGLAAAAADLRPEGDLTRILIGLLPPEESERWRHFVEVVVANLRHALRLPVTRRNEAWVRWLFLIPYTAAPERA